MFRKVNEKGQRDDFSSRNSILTANQVWNASKYERDPGYRAMNSYPESIREIA